MLFVVALLHLCQSLIHVCPGVIGRAVFESTILADVFPAQNDVAFASDVTLQQLPGAFFLFPHIEITAVAV